MSTNETNAFWIEVHEGEEYIGRLGYSDEEGEYLIGPEGTISIVMWYELEEARAIAEELTKKEDNGRYTYRANGGSTSVAGNVLDYLTEEEFQEMIAGGDVPKEKLAALHNMMREHQEKMGREDDGENELPPDGHPLFTAKMVNNEGGVGVQPQFNTPMSMLFPTIIASLRVFKSAFEQNTELISQLKEGEDLAIETLTIMDEIELLLNERLCGEGISIVANLKAKRTNNGATSISGSVPNEISGEFWRGLLLAQYQQLGENGPQFSSFLSELAYLLKSCEQENEE